MNSPSELQSMGSDNKPQFVVKRWAKRHTDSAQSLVDPLVLDVSDVVSVEAPDSSSLDSREWLVVSPSKSCISSHRPSAKAMTAACVRWDLNNMSAGYRPSATPLPKLGGLPVTCFQKLAPQIKNPSQGSHPYRAPPVRSRLFSPGFAALCKNMNQCVRFSIQQLLTVTLMRHMMLHHWVYNSCRKEVRTHIVRRWSRPISRLNKCRWRNGASLCGPQGNIVPYLWILHSSSRFRDAHIKHVAEPFAPSTLEKYLHI